MGKLLDEKSEKQGAIGGALGTLLIGWFIPAIAGGALWAYGSTEHDKKLIGAGKGVLIGTGVMVAAEIAIALIIIAVMPVASVEYQNAASLLAKNGIKIPPKQV